MIAFVFGCLGGQLVVLLLCSMVVATRGALKGLTVGISVSTFGIDACGCMEHVISLFSLL
jgi:hypothetical protein